MSGLTKALGLMTGVGPLMTALRTSWDSFDAYGTVPRGESATVALPAGPISVSFASGEESSRGVVEDLPTIVGTAGTRVPVEFMGRLQGPRSMKRGYLADERIRKRFATAEIPADGEYVVTAAACTVLLGTAGFSRKPRAVPAASSVQVAS
jgi:hypothetical protein